MSLSVRWGSRGSSHSPIFVPLILMAYMRITQANSPLITMLSILETRGDVPVANSQLSPGRDHHGLVSWAPQSLENFF